MLCILCNHSFVSVYSMIPFLKHENFNVWTVLAMNKYQLHTYDDTYLYLPISALIKEGMDPSWSDAALLLSIFAYLEYKIKHIS